MFFENLCLSFCNFSCSSDRDLLPISSQSLYFCLFSLVQSPYRLAKSSGLAFSLSLPAPVLFTIIDSVPQSLHILYFPISLKPQSLILIWPPPCSKQHCYSLVHCFQENHSNPLCSEPRCFTSLYTGYVTPGFSSHSSMAERKPNPLVILVIP